MKRVLLLASLVCAQLGCNGDEGAEAFPTYQECFDDHTEEENLPVKEAIIVCCLEHPIGGTTMVCGGAKADCVNYLTNNLKQTSASVTDVMDACDEYVNQLEM
ncbi:MAG: hypothetical protein AB7O24_26840 [Kofleriaceae bacterium]